MRSSKSSGWPSRDEFNALSRCCNWAVSTAATTAHRSLSVWVFILFTGFVFGASGLVSKSLIDNGVDAFIVTGVPFAAGALLAWVVAVLLGQVRREAIVSGLVLGVLNSAVPSSSTLRTKPSPPDW